MSRSIHRLTVLQVNKAARQKKTACDGGGLYLQDGSSWIYRYTRNGRTRYHGLGPLMLVDLSEARAGAQACRKMLFEGTDPLEHRKARRASAALQAATSITFDECIAAYLATHGDGWRSAKHKQAWGTSLRTHVSPVLGKLPVASIDTPLVLQALEPIWKKTTETASRLRGRIESVLNFAGVKGYRDAAIPNPARWKGHLDQLLAAKSAISKVQHFASLPYAELPAFMMQLRKEEGVGPRALELTILCGVRTGDTLGMRWSHVDIDQRLWTIPKTKNGSEHRVPLSDAAISVLDAMKPLRDATDVVFRGSDKLMLRALERMGRKDVTTHGFRSALKTWASEQTGFERDVVESALTHTIKDQLERAYRRTDYLDKRVRLMGLWADFCNGRTVPHEDATNVVALRG